MIRVLIADDHPVFLEGLRLLLDSTSDLAVVGAAPDGSGLLTLAATTPFDVAVVDLDMPGLDGAATTRELLGAHPDGRVLVLTMHEDEASVQRALRAGAQGYLLKGAAQGAIVRAIHAVADGETVLAGGVGDAVLRAATASRPHADLPGLTAREVEVLDLVARGLTNPVIATKLFLSIKTVQNRVSDLLAKTGCSTRAQLVAHARDVGLGD